jgi:hypothetical protein
MRHNNKQKAPTDIPNLIKKNWGRAFLGPGAQLFYQIRNIRLRANRGT